LFAISAVAVAQQVPTDPTSTHIFPAGGRRGTVVDVRVGGECLPPGTRFRLFGVGVRAPLELGEPTTGHYAPSPRRKPSEQPTTHPREWKSRIDIASDAPSGVCLWRLSCGRGGTGSRPFVVGDLPEFIETEPNSLPDRAEVVELPVTINGQIAGESDLDYFRFTARAGEIVRADIAAARLGSALDPLVQVMGPDGQKVLFDDRRIGADPVLAFRAATTGEYRLLISNVTYRGGPSYVYRITLSTAPLIQYAFPAGGRAGETVPVSFLALTGTDSLRTLTQAVTFPKTSGTIWQAGLEGANSLPLQVSDLPEVVETNGHDAREAALDVSSPVVINGQFETTADEDWYRLTCRQEAGLSIECGAALRWSPAFPIVSITNTDGGVLTTASAVQTPRGAIQFDWQPPADGTYYLRVRDLQQGARGGPEFVYRMRITPAVPDFALSLKTDSLNVVQGGRIELDVTIDRRGGLTVPIELSVDGLPEGVRVEGTTVAANQPLAKLAFIADGDARATDVTLRITGRAVVSEQTIERAALATHLAHDVDLVGLGASEIDHIQLTVVHKPVFKLYCNEAYQYAHRGTVYPYLMEIERLEGFDGPIHLQVADRQIKDLDGIEIVNTTIAPGETKVMLPLYLPETMHINVQAHSNVYAQGHVEFVDEHGQKQTMLVVSTMRCMIRTLPTVAKLRSMDREMAATSGTTIRCPVAIDRTSQFQGPMQIELMDAAPGITAATVTLPANQSQTDVLVQIDPSVKHAANMALKFRAVGNMGGDVKVITETIVPLELNR